MKFDRESVISRLNKSTIVDKNGCWIWTAYINPGGYGCVGVGGRQGRTVLVHRLSAHLFNGFDLDSTAQINHSCDARACWNPEHLHEGNHLTNMRECVERGRYIKGRVILGTEHPVSKLSDEQVREIRRIYAEGCFSQRDLAKLFPVSQARIQKILTGEGWPHI